MKKKFSGWYPKDPDDILKLWDNAIFVPDANVLLHCLRHPTVVREELLRLMEVIGDSLWIPYQVGLEFHRNRLGVEFGALDAYDTLLKDQEIFIEKARDRLRQLRAHPTINVMQELSFLDLFFLEFKERMEAARAIHPSVDISAVVERITILLENRVGNKLSTEKLILLKKEGEERYSKKIPPGYKDSKKDAGEFDKFGDLIIWKEMIEKAKLDTRPIIFISDDAKEDWWWIHRGRKIGARPELIEEFFGETKQDFHIYEFSQFLRFAAERFPGIKENVAKVAESLLADENARKHRNDESEALEQEAQLRILEDERDHIIGILSGTPGNMATTPIDRAILRVRLSKLNEDIISIFANRDERIKINVDN